MNPLLGRWISADPLAIHSPGEADLNVYAYVSGQVLKNVDPLGLQSTEVNGEGAGGDVDVPEGHLPSGGTLPEVNIHVDPGGGADGAGGAPSGSSDPPASAPNSDPSPGATGASGADDVRTPDSGCYTAACVALDFALKAAADTIKSLTSLPSGDSPCSSAADCQQRSETADAQSLLIPLGVGARRAILKGGKALRAKPKVAPRVKTVVPTLRMGNAVGADVKRIRVRHYTKKNSLDKIRESEVVLASDQGKVFTVRAKGKPLSPRDSEETLGIKRGHGNAYLEFDARPSEFELVKRGNGVRELVFKGHVDLKNRNATFHSNQ